MKPRQGLTARSETAPIGWREWIGLPDLGIALIKAKIDTGARTSALHAVKHEAYQENGVDWIAFHVPRPGVQHSERCKARLIDTREIKNTSGIPVSRYVVSTTLVLGNRHWPIELSLADRGNMGFAIILGRTAIRRHGLLVDPGRSFLAGPPEPQLLPKSSRQTAVRS